MENVKNQLFTKSEKFREDYYCTVVRIGELNPIEGSDFLAQVMVDGNSLVVRKDECSTGDLMFYCSVECELNHEYLAANNLFSMDCYEKNANAKEVEKLLEIGRKDDAKKITGFFNKHGNVRLIRLRGCPSMGFLFSLETLVKWNANLAKLNITDLESLIGEAFDTIDGNLFVKGYVPMIYAPRTRHAETKNEKRLKKKHQRQEKAPFGITEEFHEHYDTKQLQRNIRAINPTDSVTISVKIHGTSSIIGNLHVKKFRKKNLKDIIHNIGIRIKACKETNRFLLKPYNIEQFTANMQELRSSYINEPYELIDKVVSSSRRVIKTKGFKKSNYSAGNEYERYGELLAPYVPEGWTIYSEIYGYKNYADKYHQKDYDYGCEPARDKIMPYRITVIDRETSTTKDLEVSEVYEWTVNLIKEHPEFQEVIEPIHILYNGTLTDLYPEIPVDENWHTNILNALRTDKNFHMEENEPLCKNKVPREGIVLRINNDEISEAFKLKCIKFLEHEGKQISAGIVDDELLEGYTDQQDEEDGQ